MSVSQANPTIWLIDDEAAEHALLRMAFEPILGEQHISSLYSAEEAIQRLESGESPSLVLLDLNMPGLGGMHFLRQRRARNYDSVPVVVLSSSSNPTDISDSYSAGASTYVEKPPDLKSLRTFARTMADYWFGIARLPPASAA